MTSCLFPWRMKLSHMGATLKRKNLLPEEQILFFKSGPPLRNESKME